VRWLVVLCALACCARGSDAPAAGTRIVSLTPSATEVIAALGATSQLVGVVDYSEFPAEVKALTNVGSFMQPKVEAIVRLRATLVIVDDIHATSAHALGDAGIATIACPMHGLADLRGCLQAVGARLGKAKQAQAVIASIDRAIADARAHPVSHVKVLAVIDRAAGGLGNAVAAGPGSWIGELLDIEGADNVLASANTRYPKVSLETMLRAEPDVILDLSGQDLAAWTDLDVPAVKHHKVIALADKPLQGPGPRVEIALAALARVLR
jgi:iron complex transport system substrate-binding protein